MSVANDAEPNFLAKELRYPHGNVWILFAVVLVLRLLMLPINAAEYTDGILQARQFIHPVGIWPPLYSGLIYILQPIFGYLYAGRLISVIASALAIIPIYLMTRRSFGTRAAIYAGIFYIVAPVANRWGIRLMTDSTFFMLFIWAAERLCFASDERDQSLAFKALGWACVLSVLATLTRYQGLMLFPPILVCAIIIWRRFKSVPIFPMLWCAGLLLLPVWEYLIGTGFIHDDQFQDRSLGFSLDQTLRIMALNGEAFALYIPYFLTYPVAIMALAGMFWMRQRRGVFFSFLMIYTAVALLLAQSAFSSFQERYFLPLFGFFWVLAGAGLFAFQDRWFRGRRQPWEKRVFPYLMIIVFGYSAIFSFAVLLFQRETWGDVAAASKYAGEIVDEDTIIFTNEKYKDTGTQVIAGDKVEFFSGHDKVEYLSEAFIPTNLSQSPPKDLPKGSIVVLSSIYGGEAYERYLRSHYNMVLLGDSDKIEDKPFVATIMPLLPDNTPGYDQSPLAWFQRYNWQRFETKVYRVEGRRGR